MSDDGKSENQSGDATRAIHAGEDPPFWGHALLPPIAQSSTFVFDSIEQLLDHKLKGTPHPQYGRYGNPTVSVVEQKIADLEGAEDALITASGLAAITVICMSILRSGGHFVFTADHYAGTRALFDNVLPRFDVSFDIVPVNDFDALNDAIRRETSFVFTEMPTNPHLRVPDLKRLVEVAKAKNTLTVVDATLASPLLCRPLEFGVDLVTHSATKYLGGHNDLLAGVVAGSAPMLEVLRETNGLIGTVLPAHDTALLNRGIKTLPLRIRQHSETGAEIAARLANDPRVAKTYYPGIGPHCDPETTQTYLPHGAGGLLSFQPEGGTETAHAFLERLTLFKHAGSLGGAESLIQIPYLFSMVNLPEEEASRRGLEPDLVRLSIGLEDVEDLWSDIDHALGNSG